MSDTVAGLEAEPVSSADSLHISNIQSFIWAWENIMCYWEIVKEAFPPHKGYCYSKLTKGTLMRNFGIGQVRSFLMI